MYAARGGINTWADDIVPFAYRTCLVPLEVREAQDVAVIVSDIPPIPQSGAPATCPSPVLSGRSG